MDISTSAPPTQAWPKPSAVLELIKPVTWFPPMWAFMCGVISSGLPFSEIWTLALLGAVLAGPLACGASQAMNDWCDREVDAINEPNRPIPSGRMPGRWGYYVTWIWSAMALAFAAWLGLWVFIATAFGLFCGWLYSSPPMRLKKSGWWGPGIVAVSYEGLAWFTGAAVVIGTLPDARIVMLAVLFSAGAHGIMTLNDFKAVEGDRQMGIKTLPAELGVANAAFIACVIMAAPQIIVVALMVKWGLGWTSIAVALLVVAQLGLMVRWMREPARLAPWFNLTGVLMYVSGMLISAIGVGSLVGAS